MRGIRWHIGVGAAVVVLACQSSLLEAGTYQDPANHYDFALFDNWIRWPNETLEMANQFARSRSLGHNIQFAAGFQRKGQPLGTYPYMLLQIQQHSNVNSSYEEIERGIAAASGKATRQLKGVLSDITKDVSIDSAVLDRANNRVVIRYQLTVPNAGKIEGISLANIGKQAIVTLHYYDHASKFSESVKSFLILGNSFEFEKDYRFKAVPPNAFQGDSFQLTMIVGLVVFSVLALGGVLLQARTTKRDATWTTPIQAPREPW